MKKRVAVFANGWSDEYVQTVMSGVYECAVETNTDIFLFVEYASRDEVEEENLGDLNILNLTKPEDFDGVLLLANTLNMGEQVDFFFDRIRDSGVPAVSLEYVLDGMDFLGTENYSGMYDLANHLIEVHDAKDFLFVAGLPDNRESMIRCQALTDAMERKGLTLSEDNIIYGYFSDLTAQKEFAQWMETHDLPDAIVCANDIMAMGICLWLQNRGYSVPKDVAVTGYDCIESGKTCHPSITTVERDWDKLGYIGLNQLLRKMAGHKTQSHQATQSKLVVAESCGCVKSYEDVKYTGTHQSIYGRRRENMDFDSHNRALYRRLRGINTADEVGRVVVNFYDNNHAYEGGDFGICLVEDFFDTLQTGEELDVEGYPAVMKSICCFRQGKPVAIDEFETKDLLPFYERDPDRAHLFIFTGLHSADKCMGYAYFVDNPNVVENYTLYTWTRHMNQYLEQIRQNIRLEELNKQLTELSVTDALTGVYNRMGYEKYAIPYLEKCREEGRHGVMMLVDINHMKQINDKYGHLQGDAAIRTVASGLKKAVPGDWIVVRYGGDEFFVVGQCETQSQMDSIKQDIHLAIQNMVVENKLPFELTASVGAVWIQADEALDINACFRRTDASMYEMKKKQHEKNKQE